MAVDKHLGEGSLDPTTGFGTNGSLMRASNSGALSGHARGLIGVAIIALVALVAGAIFVLNRPDRIGILPFSVAPRVSTVPATAPPGVSPVSVAATVQSAAHR